MFFLIIKMKFSERTYITTVRSGAGICVFIGMNSTGIADISDYTHSSAENATAWTALVFDHTSPVVLAQYQQRDTQRRTHHLLFLDGSST